MVVISPLPTTTFLATAILRPTNTGGGARRNISAAATGLLRRLKIQKPIFVSEAAQLHCTPTAGKSSSNMAAEPPPPKRASPAVLNPSRHLPSVIGGNPKPSVWVEFIELANECNAINLGQGFPNSPMPAFLAKHLVDVAGHPERTDLHQYTRGYGHPRLVHALAKLYSHLFSTRTKVEINAQTDVLITIGAYLSLYYAFLGWLNPGDEAIVFEPAYDSYVSQIQMAGGVPVPIALELNPAKAKTSAGFELNLETVRSKITPRTKMLVLNNPNNPVGKLYTRAELEGLAQLAEEHDLLVVSDEVYEWHVYPGGEMLRFASLPGMYQRTITIGSAGKCFSATGWKLGWSIGPQWLLEPLKKVHENCVFTSPTPTQEAVARALEDELKLIEAGDAENSYFLTGLVKELLPKRDLMAKYLEQAGFNPIMPDGGYFMLADFGHLDGPFKKATGAEKSEMAKKWLDYRFVYWLCQEKRLAAIPPTAFYSEKNKAGNDHFIRICFFKTDETLKAAIDVLKQFSK